MKEAEKNLRVVSTALDLGDKSKKNKLQVFDSSYFLGKSY